MSKRAPVEIVVIADRSGSMSSIKDDAIGGFNTFLSEQQALKGAANLTLVLFDNEYQVAVDSIPVKEVKPLDGSTFVPRGSTAMNDAIGRALSALEAKNPKRAIVCILTDGFENSSREFTTSQVKEKIKAAEDKGYQVVYLAANQDAFAVGSTLGIAAGSTVNFAATASGVRDAYKNVSLMSTSYRAA